MNYPCGIIRDLLPLYMDDFTNEESKVAVEAHLSQCEECRKYYEAMAASDGYTEKNENQLEDMRMVESLKKIKRKINKQMKRVIVGSMAAVVLVILLFNLLFHMPVKNIALDDIHVTVLSYPIEEVVNNGDTAYDSVKITANKTDNSPKYQLEIPEMPDAEISISGNVIDSHEVISVITWSSPYHIREIRYADKKDDTTICIEAFKTTLLNSQVEGSQQAMQMLEFREIEKIVFVDDGQETVLWSK